MNKDLLLSREQYAEARKNYGPSPFTFEIENEKQALFYFGANHSRNPKNRQYLILKEYWKRFLRITEGKDKIILIEGKLRNVPKDEELAIINGAEGDLITLFAQKEHIPVACPDISYDEFSKRMPNVNKDNLLLLHFLRWLDNFQTHTNPKPDCEKAFQKWCDNEKKKEIWSKSDLSIDKLIELYKRIIGKKFNKDESQNHLINPNETETIINKLSTAHSDLRELNIVSEIEKYWKEEKSIFVVFGSGHLIIQKPALKNILK